MIKVGDRIGYSAHFLSSIGGDLELSERRGTVKALEQRGRASTALILWDDMPSIQRALVSNIARVGSLAFSDPHVKHKAFLD